MLVLLRFALLDHDTDITLTESASISAASIMQLLSQRPESFQRVPSVAFMAPAWTTIKTVISADVTSPHTLCPHSLEDSYHFLTALIHFRLNLDFNPPLHTP